MSAENRLTTEQLAVLAAGDYVLIESGAEFGRRRCAAGTVVRRTETHVVVRCGTYVEHYRLRDGVRVGGAGRRAELVCADGSELPLQKTRRQTRRISALYRQWMKNPSDVDSLRDLHAAIGERLQQRVT